MHNLRISKNKVFILLFFFLYFLSFLFLFTRKGVGLYFHPFSTDSFMDLFNMISNPFNSSYPPLSLIPFKILYLTIQPNTAALPSTELKNNYLGAFFLMLYVLSFSVVLLYTIYFSIKGNCKRKIFYSVVFLFSGIVLWTVERANVMSFAFLFSLLFVVFYIGGDEKDKRRSYLFIALAISLKLYPGAFLLFMLEKKDFKGIFSVALQTLVIFVFSYMVCAYLDFLIGFERKVGLLDYMNDIKSYIKVLFHLACIFVIIVLTCLVLYEVYMENWGFLKKILFVFIFLAICFQFAKGSNLLGLARNVFISVVNALRFGEKMTSSVEGVNVSFKNFFILIFFLLTGNKSFSNPLFFMLCKLFFVALCLFSFFVHKNVWKKLLSVVFLCIYVPDFAGFYLLVYLLIPLVFFINDKDGAKIDYIYACLFAVVTTFFIVPFKLAVQTYYLVTGTFVVISLCVFCLFLLLAANAVYELMSKNGRKNVQALSS